MDEEPLSEKPDLALGFLAKQDLYAMSVEDLRERIEALNTEVARCDEAISKRGDSRSDAEKLFKI